MSKRREISAALQAHLNEEYGDRFKEVREVYPEFTKDQEVRLGILLNNIDEAIGARFDTMLNEDATLSAPNVIQGIKTTYFDIVEAVFPNLIAEELFSVQPIQNRTGQIFFLRYVYGTTKGNVTKGSTIFGPNEIAGYENANYTREHIEDESITAPTADALQAEVSLTYYPVIKGSVEITIDSAVIHDDGLGKLLDANNKIRGSVDYSTGKCTIFAGTTAFKGTEDITADYDSTFESNPSSIPEIELKIDDTFVHARPRKLRGLYSFDAGYDLKQSQGIDIQEALLQAAAMQLKNETDGELIRTAYDQAGRTTTWTNNPTSQPALSRKEYYEAFVEHIFQECSAIRQKTKRVSGNFIVCGKKAGDILQFIGAPRFVGTGYGAGEVGPYYAGMLDNRIKVYIDPFLAEDEYLIGYKGQNLIDAGLIYAPYLLFFATETVTLDDFLGRRGFCTSYGKKMINNNFYISGKIV